MFWFVPVALLVFLSIENENKEEEQLSENDERKKQTLTHTFIYIFSQDFMENTERGDTPDHPKHSVQD